MRKFLQLSSWAAVVGITWSLGYVYNVRYGGELSWLRMMYEQKMAIASQVQAPRRVIIIGGSGAHYTVDARVMQEQLGIPVLNLGLDGPVGLDVILPSISGAIRPGDVVLLIPEYLILQAEDGRGDRSSQFGWAIGRPGLGDIPVQQLAQGTLMLGTPTLRAATKSTLDLFQKGRLTGYYSDPVDSYGNPTVLKQRSSAASWWQLRIAKPITNHAAERITQFRDQLKQQGATLVLGLPWIYGSREENTLQNIQKTADRLAQIAPVLYNRADLNVKTDYTLFADTHYHLNQPGRKTRSLELSQQLKTVLGDRTTGSTPTP